MTFFKSLKLAKALTTARRESYRSGIDSVSAAEKAESDHIRRMTKPELQNYILEDAWEKATGERVKIITEAEIELLREQVANHDFMTGKDRVP